VAHAVVDERKGSHDDAEKGEDESGRVGEEEVELGVGVDVYRSGEGNKGGGSVLVARE
jgi:hypothetical protein